MCVYERERERNISKHLYLWIVYAPNNLSISSESSCKNSDPRKIKSYLFPSIWSRKIKSRRIHLFHLVERSLNTDIYLINLRFTNENIQRAFYTVFLDRDIHNRCRRFSELLSSFRRAFPSFSVSGLSRENGIFPQWGKWAKGIEWKSEHFSNDLPGMDWKARCEAVKSFVNNFEFLSSNDFFCYLTQFISTRSNFILQKISPWFAYLTKFKSIHYFVANYEFVVLRKLMKIEIVNNYKDYNVELSNIISYFEYYKTKLVQVIFKKPILASHHWDQRIQCHTDERGCTATFSTWTIYISSIREYPSR